MILNQSHKPIQNTLLKSFDIMVIKIIINKITNTEFNLMEHLEKFRNIIINQH